MRTSPTDPALKTDDGKAELPEPARRAGSPTERELAEAPRGVAGASWQEIKGRFVDDPEGALEAAEKSVLVAVERAIRALKDEAAALCAPAHDEDASSTEGRRTRLIRYQAFCDRLAGKMTH